MAPHFTPGTKDTFVFQFLVILEEREDGCSWSSLWSLPPERLSPGTGVGFTARKMPENFSLGKKKPFMIANVSLLQDLRHSYYWKKLFQNSIQALFQLKIQNVV